MAAGAARGWHQWAMAAGLGLAGLTTATAAHAQKAPKTQPAPKAAAPKAAPKTAAAAAKKSMPRLPKPSPELARTLGKLMADPLLAPLPKPKVFISSWKDALTRAQRRTVDMQVAILDFERAAAQGRIALAAALPTLNLSANITQGIMRTPFNFLTGTTEVQTFPDNAMSYGSSVTLQVPLFAPRAWYGVGTAKRRKRASSLTMLDQKRRLALSVANAIVSVVSAERVAELNRVALGGALQRQALMLRRKDLGAASDLDVVRMEQEVATARSQVVTNNESLRRARESLGLAMGVSGQVGLTQGVRVDGVAAEGRRLCRSKQRLGQRADMLAARMRVELAKRGVRDVELAFWPTVALQSTYNLSRQPFVTPTVNELQTRHTWNISGVLSWNLFDGGVRYGQLRDQRAALKQEQVRAAALKRSARVEITRAARGVQVAKRSLGVAKSAATLAARTEQLARRSFELGAGGSLDLVDAARRLRQAQIQVALREFELVQAELGAFLAVARCDY